MSKSVDIPRSFQMIRIPGAGPDPVMPARGRRCLNKSNGSGSSKRPRYVGRYVVVSQLHAD